MNCEQKEYKGFEIIFIRDIPDCNSKGIYLRHKKTGLEVFHLLNDDQENLCSFNFRTPPETSDGIAHILEHSVLCGSEKYPLKDPFIHLENQSLNTYLNALTASDRTMYPIASVIEEDYFNLMSVYADSVFFPRLDYEVFLQEARRLEKDEKGNYSIQGVVYNEMKGSYSNFSQVSFDKIDQAILKGTIYAKDSGGDPSEIPNLTYEKYLKTHKKFYRPSNCLVFLYGNIPTEKQLDFLQTDLLDRIEKRLDQYEPLELLPVDIIKNSVPEKIQNNNKIEAYVPNVHEQNKDENPSVLVAWRLFNGADLTQFLEAALLLEILVQHDGSPMTKALLDSGLGTEVSGLSGIESSTNWTTALFGLDGVKQKNVDKVYDLIIKTLKDLIKNGISQDDIDCAVMEFEISNREVVRSSGPFSLVYLRRVLKAWSIGESPDSNLYFKSAFEKIKENIKSDKNYFSNLLTKYFIENDQFSICVLTPSPKFAKECQDKENSQIEKMKKELSDQELEEQTKKLRQFQQCDETEKMSCLPYLDARKIKYSIPQIKTEFSFLEYQTEVKEAALEKSTFKVPLAINVENTNGINYFSVYFPIDILSAEEYQYVNILSYMLTELGWNGMTWDECSTIVNKNSGSFYCSVVADTCSNTERGKKLYEEFAKYNIPGRDWFSVKIKMLAENFEQCLDFFADCITSTDFTDRKRVKNLFNEYLADFENSISAGGHLYMLSRANCSILRSKAVEEFQYGITCLNFLRSLKGKEKLICKKISEIAQKIFTSGSIISLICDNESKENNILLIKKFASRLKLKSPDAPFCGCSFDELVKMAKVDKKLSNPEIFYKNIQVGFAACAFECSPYATSNAAAESVYAHWLSNTILWQQVRTISGAYGASASFDPIEKIANIMTYRDPNPYKSLAQIEECLRLGTEFVFTEEDTVKAITGRFSTEIKPRTPKALGNIGFERFLYCIDQEDVNKRVELLLKVTPEDMHCAAVRLYENFMNKCNKAVLAPKSCKISSKIAKIEL